MVVLFAHVPEVNRLDLGVLLDFARRAVRQDGSPVQHGHPVGDPHDDFHVVLDEQNGDSL